MNCCSCVDAPTKRYYWTLTNQTSNNTYSSYEHYSNEKSFYNNNFSTIIQLSKYLSIGYRYQ